MIVAHMSWPIKAMLVRDSAGFEGIDNECSPTLAANT